MRSLDHLEQRLGDYCQWMRQGLESFDFEAKRTALKALQIKAMGRLNGRWSKSNLIVLPRPIVYQPCQVA